MGIEQSTSKQEVAEASWQIAGVSWANIALFVVLAFALSWCIWIVLRAVGIPLLIYGAIGMFGPTLASV
ncbi:MAG: hypothetical protein JO011_14220, partial [Ktedonobacteraceae bacterium]|nr:hypothetical protein [Ktedonobacteraceae bacterium]